VSGVYAYREDGCMPACVASMLREPSLAWSLPVAVGGAWFDRFNEALTHQASAFLTLIPFELLPWRREEEWIAGIELDRGPHAIVAYGVFVAWDPADELQPGRPAPRDRCGLAAVAVPAGAPAIQDGPSRRAARARKDDRERRVSAFMSFGDAVTAHISSEPGRTG
jgi:hypothetical protein